MSNRRSQVPKSASGRAAAAKRNRRIAKKQSDGRVQVLEDSSLTPAGQAMAKFIDLVLPSTKNCPVRAAIGRGVIVAFDAAVRVADKASPQVLQRESEPPSELVAELGPKVEAFGEVIGLFMPATGRTALPSELETALQSVLVLSHMGGSDSEAIRKVLGKVRSKQPRMRGRAVNYARRKAAIDAWEMHIQRPYPSWGKTTNAVCKCGKDRHDESCKKSLLIEIRRIEKLLKGLGIIVPGRSS